MSKPLSSKNFAKQTELRMPKQALEPHISRTFPQFNTGTRESSLVW